MSIEEARAVPYRFVPAVCILALLCAFIVDLFTPELFVAAILLDVPIVLSSLGAGERFRFWLIVAALACDIIAGYANGVHAGYHWAAAAIGDRMLAALSIVLVGYLSSAADANAQRAGRSAAHELRARREAQVAAAVERLRASLSTELVVRAIVRESVTLFDVAEARFTLTGNTVETLVARRDEPDIVSDPARLSPEVASLVQRAADDGEAILVERSDALGRLIIDGVDGEALLAIPVADGRRRFGVLIVADIDAARLADQRSTANAFAQQAAGALAQARLFEQLEERRTALEERSGVIRDLVYALSHDLRTPLAALGMTLRQADEGAYGELPERYREIVARSIIATDDVQRLAETLLLVARFESGDRRPERETIELAGLARQIGGELDALAKTRDVALHVDVGAAARTIGDRGDVRRAITNLAANALEHTPAGGTVTISVDVSASTALVRVADDGFGVSEKARAHLFARFARGDDRRGGGSGLGLYIVRRVAEESGGSVTYEPNVPRGSVFTLRFPVSTAP